MININNKYKEKIWIKYAPAITTELTDGGGGLVIFNWLRQVHKFFVSYIIRSCNINFKLLINNYE